MQFPESWLREFCNPPLNTAELADLLTMSAWRWKNCARPRRAFEGVVVGRVLSVQRHPNADKLNVCQVDIGAAEPLNIVCGAPNVAVGIKVPCALVGAVLPPAQADGEGFEIKLSMLRGVESQGMLCSARELKLSEDHGGLLLLAADAPVGQGIREHLRLDDTLFTLKLTPNLGHGLSVFGIARELSALTGSPLLNSQRPAVQPSHADTLKVTVDAADLCGRFSGRIVRGVNTQAATPAWMIERLARCGQRSVTALVDISNYVMFESGQPTHIFDLDRISGGLTVRWGRPGETLKLLNGNSITVDEQVGVIADAHAVESLAGIMGGDSTAVSNDTKNVYVEAASGGPRPWPAVRAASTSRPMPATASSAVWTRRARSRSSSASRNSSSTSAAAAPDRSDDQTIALPEAAPVTLRVARAAKVVGMPITQAQCADVFRRMGLRFTEGDGALIVTPPSWRFDLRIEEDLIEEVIRVIGFDSLPDTLPMAP